MIATNSLRMVFNANTPLENYALRNMDLRINAGEFVTMIGSNGSGKSTLLRLLSGEYQPTAGTVHISDIDVTAQPHYLRARTVAQVFQDPLAGTCADLTIEENMALATMRCTPRRLNRAVSSLRRTQFAEQVRVLGLGLENRLDDRVGLLSGGQRQALSLLMSTLTDCKVLLLDEHTAALDPRMSEFVLELTDKLYHLHSLTILMVTHSMINALQLGSRTLMLHLGECVLDITGEKRVATTKEELFAEFARLHTRDLLRTP